MKLQRIAAVILVLALVTLLLPRLGERPAATGRFRDVRIGLVFDVGGRGDKSFNDAAWEGLERARRELGVTTEIIEPTGAEDRESALRLFAARGFDLVVAVGFIFSTDVNVTARDFPNVRFACIDYTPPPSATAPPNVLGLGFREHEGSFLVGAVAGLLSRTHHVGFVGGMDIPLIHRFEAGYRAGIGHVCPDCQLHVGYAGTTPEAFRDPAKGKAVAVTQISAGADVIYQVAGATGHGVFEAARSMGVKAIGVDSDQYDEMPGTVVTSMVKRVDVAVFDAIVAVLEGRFEGGEISFGIAEQGVGYVHEGPHAEGLAPELRKRVNELAEQVAQQQIIVPSSRSVVRK